MASGRGRRVCLDPVRLVLLLMALPLDQSLLLLLLLLPLTELGLQDTHSLLYFSSSTVCSSTHPLLSLPILDSHTL